MSRHQSSWLIAGSSKAGILYVAYKLRFRKQVINNNSGYEGTRKYFDDLGLQMELRKRKGIQKRLYTCHRKKYPYRCRSRMSTYSRHQFTTIDELHAAVKANHHKQTVQSNDVSYSNDVQSNEVSYSTTTANSKNLLKCMEKLPLWSSKSNVHDFLDEFERTTIDYNIDLDNSSLFRLFIHSFKKDPATLNTITTLQQFQRTKITLYN